MISVVNSFKEKQMLKALDRLIDDERMQEFFDVLEQEGVLLKVDHVANDIA